MAENGVRQGKIVIPAGVNPWEHELRAAKILARSGYYVEFLPEGLLPRADILLDGVEYEIKSPERFTPNTLEHTIKDALKQSQNIIIDTSRMKKVKDMQVCNFLVRQACSRKQIKKLLLITKQEGIIDIFKLI